MYIIYNAYKMHQKHLRTQKIVHTIEHVANLF